MIKGGCQCGTVKYEVTGELKDYCHCHCSICRKVHAAAYTTWGGIARNEFSFVSGEDNLTTYPFSDNADSIFCKTCGSTVLVDFKSAVDMLYITIGTVDGEIDIPPGHHQFAGDKVYWHEIGDNLPQYKAWPSDEE